jgi:deoxyadenosine/deoxycytidine kinase
MEEGQRSATPAPPRTFLMAFSGIVGVGKSTLIKRLRKTGLLQSALPAHVHVSFVREPSRLWQERGWLGKFYADPSHNAAAFQFQVFCTYVDAVERTLAECPSPSCQVHVIVVERSFFCQRLFWEQQREGGMATADDNYNDAYVLVWERWRRFIPEPDLVFLCTTTHMDSTMRRVQARARAEEMGASFSSAEDQPLNASMAGLDLSAAQQPIQEVGGLTLAYQERLQRKHHEWFTQPVAHPLGASPEGIRCVHISTDDPYHVDDGSLERLAALMARHIAEQIK